MFDVPSFKLGRVFGIPVEVNITWLVIFGLVVFTLATNYFPEVVRASGAKSASIVAYYTVSAVTALLFFSSILAHELSHSLVVRAGGGHVGKITLFIFGGVAQMDDEPKSPGREFVMASAGPAMSLVLAALSYIAFLITASNGAPWWIWAPLQYLGVINAFVGVFNLLPGFPLDGGRVLRSILWAITHDMLKATRWAVRVGQFIGWSMVVLAVLSVLRGSTDLIWFGLIGWFIASLAGQAYRQQLMKSKLAGLTVASIMTESPDWVNGEDSLEVLVNEHLLGRRHSRYPVFYDGAIVGLVSLPSVKGVDRADWPFVPTIDVTDRDIQALKVPTDAPVESLLPRLAGDRPGALLVVGDGRLVGIVTRADVIAALERSS